MTRGLFPSAATYPATSVAPASPSSFSTVAVVEERPPDKLAVIIRDPATGAIVGRWAEDEPHVENVFANLTKGGEMPGGHKEMGCVLSRDPRLSWPDMATYSPVEVQAAGREKVWEGYLQKKPATDGDHVNIAPAVAGYQAMLEDDKGAVGPGFINQDQSAWIGPSSQRKIDVGSTWDQSASPGIDPDPSGQPQISISSTGKITKPVWAIFFDAGSGIRIERVAGLVSPINLGTSATDINVGAHMYAMDDDRFSGSETLGDVSAGSGFSFPVSNKRYVAFQGEYFATAAGTEGVEYGYRLARLIVIGATGLVLQGTWPLVGYFAKQMLEYGIPRQTPLEARPEDIEDDKFLITQAWYADPGPPSSWVADVSKYGGLDWFVLHGRRFERRFPGTYGRRWKAYAGPSGLEKTGEDGTRLWDRLIVQWQDVDGSTKTAGPVGSGAMYEDARLEINDPDHPAVKAREGVFGSKFLRRDLLKLNGICTATEAIKTAARFLAELNQLDHSGKATLSGYNQTDTGIWLPASYVMPGDEVQFPDAADKGYRKITAPNYTDASKSCEVSLDAPREGIEALQERFNARLESLELGA